MIPSGYTEYHDSILKLLSRRTQAMNKRLGLSIYIPVAQICWVLANSVSKKSKRIVPMPVNAVVSICNVYTPLLLLVAMLLLPCNLAAVEIEGTVVEATADTAKITTESEFIPNVGDKVKIFFKVPGLDDEVLVGTATVTETSEGFVRAKIENSTGKVSRDQLVKIFSENPKKREKPKSTPVSEEKKKPTDTTPSKQTEIAKLSPEAKQHLKQGMTYASLAQSNPKTASENYNNALLEFTNAIKLYPNYAEAYSNRGVAYMQQKKFNKALEDLKKAAELKPKDPTIHYNLTALYSLQNQLDLALDELDKALEYGFDNFDALKPSGPNSDPDLKNLRKDPEFRKVLERHRVFILK
jgi:hypothetical protein